MSLCHIYPYLASLRHFLASLRYLLGVFAPYLALSGVFAPYLTRQFIGTMRASLIVELELELDELLGLSASVLAGGEERFPSPLPGPTGWRASPVCAMQEPIPD